MLIVTTLVGLLSVLLQCVPDYNLPNKCYSEVNTYIVEYTIQTNSQLQDGYFQWSDTDMNEYLADSVWNQRGYNLNQELHGYTPVPEFNLNETIEWENHDQQQHRHTNTCCFDFYFIFNYYNRCQIVYSMVF